MLGIRIISQYALDDLLNKARIKGERNQFSQVEKLKSEIEALKLKNSRLLENNRSKDAVFNIALKNESELRMSIIEIIEVYNGKAPAISITNEDLIKELKYLTSENFTAFKKQAKLLVDVAEKKNIESITAVEEYLATFESLED
jgi:hypothetical protein